MNGRPARAALAGALAVGMAATPPVDAAEPLVFTQVPLHAVLDGPLAEGSRIVALDPAAPEPRVTNLTGGLQQRLTVFFALLGYILLKQTILM